MSQGDTDRSGQRRRIHHMRRAIPVGIGDRIGQNETSFGIGVQNLDRLARARRYNVTWSSCALPLIMFSTVGNVTRHWNRLVSSCASACIAPITAAAPAMSYFIFSMPSDGLMERPPGIERYTFPDECQMIRRQPASPAGI